MRTTLLILVELAACGNPHPSGPDAAPPLDAPPPYEPPPQVAPCEVLDFPTPLFPLTEGVLAVKDVDGDGRLDLITGTSSEVGFYRGSGVTFAPKVVSSVGTAPPYFPSDAAVADLDGDGKLDLVLAIQEPISLLVMRGDGAGAFQPVASYPITNGVGSIAAGDLNGDGRPDIAYTATSSATVKVRLNTGDAALGAETAIAVGDFPTSVALADLDGDGALDVVVVSYATSTLSILRGSGDGTFKPRIDLATIQSPWDIGVSDLDADGHPDLVVSGSSSGISVHVNDGSGAFLGHVDYETAGFLDSIQHGGRPFVVGDLDRDGKLDVVTDNLVFLAGNGDGSLRPAAATHLIDDGMGLLAMGDLNGNGESDVLLTGLIGYYRGIGVLEDNGKDGFNTRVNYDMGGSANSVVPYDFNHDGYVDLVLSGSDIRIALGKPGGMFGDPKTISTLGGSVMVGDFNGDRIADLLVARYGSGATLTVSLGNGDGSFRDPAPELVVMPFFRAGAVTLGDLDGDGKTDIVVGGSGLSAFLSNGDGTFHPLVLDASPGLIFVTLSVADVNGDGQADVVGSSYYPGLEGGPPRSRATTVRLNLGNGAFSTVAVDATLSFTVADLDGDDRLDLFRGSTLRRGNGDGTFQPEVPTGIPSPVTEGQLVDITGDGRLDYVVLDSAALVPVTIYQGLGAGTFGAPAAYYGLTGPGQIADINHDGRPDIIIPGNTVNVMFARCLK